MKIRHKLLIIIAVFLACYYMPLEHLPFRNPVFEALMYFATLTEAPILHGLMGAGMGKRPALALLLAGPTLSLPNMIVIRSIIGAEGKPQLTLHWRLSWLL